MGLFSKKRSSDAEQKQQAVSDPFVVTDQTVARVAELMKKFNEAEGNFARQHAIGGDLCSLAGSGGGFEQFVRANIDSKEWFARPWKMLVAVTQRASQNADHFLIAKIFGFTHFWSTLIAPQLDRADALDVPMLSCPPAIEVKIATVALDSLRRLSSDWIIFGNSTGSVAAGDLTLAAANVLAHAPEKGVLVDESVMADARSILGQKNETKG